MSTPVEAVAERLVRVETKLDLVIADLTSRVNVDHESRIRRLEAKVWIFSGAAIAGGGVLGSVVHLLGVAV